MQVWVWVWVCVYTHHDAIPTGAVDVCLQLPCTIYYRGESKCDETPAEHSVEPLPHRAFGSSEDIHPEPRGIWMKGVFVNPGVTRFAWAYKTAGDLSARDRKE